MDNYCVKPSVFKIDFDLFHSGVPGNKKINIKDICFHYTRDEADEDPIHKTFYITSG